ncbi:MAG: hypothetical protein M3389_06310 [Actinomycetota bacterium]|nr:hypothetical protein [Actinomycetota bacterium]
MTEEPIRPKPADPDGPGPEPPHAPPPSAHADEVNERAMKEPPVAPGGAGSEDAPPG